jgi:hypothetical protein
MQRIEVTPLREAVLSSSSGDKKSSTLFDLENRLSQLDRMPVRVNDNLVAALDAERSSLLAAVACLQLYVAVMIVNGIENQIDCSDTMASTLLAEDIAMAKRLADETEDKIDGAQKRLLHLVQSAESRVQDMCVSGWLYRGAALQNYLEILLNGYVGEIGSLFAEVFAHGDHSAISVRVGSF